MGEIEAGREAHAGIVLLDGPELLRRGVPTPLPGWSAHALEDAPDVVAAIHRDYAAAGATVHTTNTFRTRRAVLGEDWERLARSAVRIARDAVPASHRIAGSIAPLRDCYRPDLSPADTDRAASRAEHRALARVLAADGCDLLLCETFPHVGEALIAVEEARATGLETWVSFTPGPAADLLTPGEVSAAASSAAELGVRAVLVNCLPVAQVLEYVRALASAVGDHVLVGAYANAGSPNSETGWDSAPPDLEEYVRAAASWVGAGATILGGCCGTGLRHTAAVAALCER